IGFVLRDESRRTGCSPDGLIGAEGLIEIKCPSTAVHLNNATEGPSLDYRRQMQFQMYVTGRAWCDFVSWDDRVGDPGLVMSVHQIEKDLEAQLEIDRNIEWAVKTIDKKVAKLRKVSEKFLKGD
ncbi:YqaJ viral recombinase family protein, partial [Candidatus Babeliales bacterium]|nr:YqaJ viral recombinase family protein [Candidatus Babeliales bacterium]